MAAIIWFVGNQLVGGDDTTIIRGYDESANLLYSIKYEGPKYAKWPRFIVADKYGHLYVPWHNNSVANPPPTEYFRKYRQNGDRIPFPELHTGEISAMAVADDGSIYVGGGGSAPSHYYFRKYNSSGVLQWSKAPRDLPTGILYSASWIRLDSAGNIVLAGTTIDSGSELTKYQPDGSLLWSLTTNGRINSIAIDGSDNIYTGSSLTSGYFDDGDNLFDLDQTNIHYFPDGNSLIQKWSSGGIYQNGYFPPDGQEVQQIEYANNKLHFYVERGVIPFNASATVNMDYSGYTQVYQWAYKIDTLKQRHWIALKTDGTAYKSGSVTTVATVDNTAAWNTAAYQSNAVFVIENVEFPALSIPVSLKAPTWQGDLYAIVPPLAIRSGLRAPTTTRDYVGGEFLPQVFRLYLTGAPGTIELPLSSISCRRGYSTVALSVVCPYLTSSQITDIETRLSVGGELVVHRGLRFAGYEQTDEMLRVPLQSLRWDAGANSASITLSGQTAEIANAKTRAISGISYRNLYQGLRRVRCAVDTYLRPGDTADLGAGESMVVAAITYWISAESATMEISE